MDSINETYCICCLGSIIDVNFKQYFIKNEVLKLSLLTESIKLCFICYKMAKHVEDFIDNVQCNQTLLKNSKDLLERSIQFKKSPIIQLSSVKLETIELSEINKTDGINDLYQVLPSPNLQISIFLTIKEEFNSVYESNMLLETIDECNDSLCNYTEEEKDEHPLKEVDKEVESEKPMKAKENEKSKVYKRTRAASKLGDSKLTDSKLSKIQDTDPVFLNTDMQQCGGLKEKEDITENAIDFMLEDRNDCNDKDKNAEINSAEDGDDPLKLLVPIKPMDIECKQHAKPIRIISNNKVNQDIKDKETTCTLKLLVPVKRMDIECKQRAKPIRIISKNKVNQNINDKETTRTLKLFVPVKPMEIESKQHAKPMRIISNNKVNQKIQDKETTCKRGKEEQILEVLFLTREECEKERKERAKSVKYVNAQYKCPDCVLGFTFQMTYERHMEKHDKEAGDYKCDICNQRTDSISRLSEHMKSHELRYRCLKCSIVRNDRRCIKDHYAFVHGDRKEHECPHCLKIFLKSQALRHHIMNVHTGGNHGCPCCPKIFKNRTNLKNHIVSVHEKEVYKKERLKRHVCQECGMAFRSPSQLKNHSIKHSQSREHYCVECDKSFKSENILKHHFNTALPHVKRLERVLVCLHCDKRFAVKRNLENHMIRKHLNIKPFKCDQCSKCYGLKRSLKRHKQMAHEGYKRPLQFRCEFCDKAFAIRQTLKLHLRTHTGERPYECDTCSARFTQVNVLKTHMRLVHLKLTRDGQPKGLKKSLKKP